MSISGRKPSSDQPGGVTVTKFEVLEVGIHASDGSYDHRDTERYTVRSIRGNERTCTLLVSAREVRL